MLTVKILTLHIHIESILLGIDEEIKYNFISVLKSIPEIENWIEFLECYYEDNSMDIDEQFRLFFEYQLIT